MILGRMDKGEHDGNCTPGETFDCTVGGDTGCQYRHEVSQSPSGGEST